MKKNYNFINNYKIELIVILILLLISICIYYFYKKYNSYENFTTHPITTWRKLGNDIYGEARGDQSGYSVALNSNGTIVAIGAQSNDGNGNNSGHVRIYKWNETENNWKQLGIDIYGEVAGDNSGNCIALSSDGLIVAIGSVFNSSYSGHVRIYKWDETETKWKQLGLDIDGQGDQSGTSVALNSDGTIVAIGAIAAQSYKGSVRIYQWIEETWQLRGSDIYGKTNGDQSGTSVSLSSNGNIVAIGAIYNANSGYNSGHIRIYKWNENEIKWKQLGPDISGELSSDQSGSSVSLSSNGTIVAIGAQNNDGNGNNSGHVRIHQWNETENKWKQLGPDIDGEAANDFSGTSVSLSGNGMIVAIGAYGNRTRAGHVRIHKWNNITTKWDQISNDIDGQNAYDQSGNSISLSSDGNIVAIGAAFNGDGGTWAGHVRIYTSSPPINCVGNLGPFSQCSKTCGGGTQTKTYTVTTPAQYGGTECPNLNGDTQIQPCNTQPCPINCKGSYGEFSECSSTCGGGTRTKPYNVEIQPLNDGTPCPTAITEPCNTQPCPINCVGSYGEFNECSSTCGGGTRTKPYNVEIQPLNDGTPCPTAITELCNTQPCPINCVGSYGEFNECSATCGGGTRTKTYEITTPEQHGGAPCPTSPPINETCNTQPCPIDCIGTFSTIEKCSKECGGGKETIKYVISQERKNGGKECEYTDGYTDRVDCNIFECTNTLDTPYYKRFKPLEYNENRAYYWRRDKLVEEGIRRNQYDLQKIHNLQTSFENETDEKKKKELQDELDLYKWRNSILEKKDKNTGLSRDKRDIITDYYPEEIGQPRVWMERHSHIPDYSY